MALGSRTDLAWRWMCIACLITCAAAYEEPYSISQMSPNSATDQRLESNIDIVLQTSSAVPQVLPQQHIQEEEEKEDERVETSHVIVERSASLHQKEESLHSSKSIEELLDTNDVEVHRQPRYYDRIQPTRTLHRPDSSSPMGIESSLLKLQGEGRGVPRSRLLPPGPHPEHPTAPKTPNSAISLRYDDTPSGRQTGGGPDIQDIITGIVKLLNGNVNVQANTQPNDGRPIRPQGTRINNRGPPRISDVPPLPPDFDTPGPASPVQMMPPPPPPQMQGPKIPPPYPFDRPPPNRERPPHRPFLDGVPLPEQIVPISNEQGYRPNNFVNNGGRPQNIPPWQRPPRPRPQNNGNRRPNPNLPMYKPRPVAVPTEETVTVPQRVEGQQPLPDNKRPQYEVYMVQNAKPDVQSNEEAETETMIDESTVGNEESEENNETNETVTQGAIVDNEGGESFVKTRDPPVVSENNIHEPPKNETIVMNNNEIVKNVFETEKLGMNSTDNTTTVKPETPTKQEVLKESDNSLDKKKLNMSGVKIDKEKFSTTKKQQEERTKEVELNIKNTIRLSADDAVKDLNNSTLVLESTPIVIEGSMTETSTSGLNIAPTPTPAGGLPAVNSASSLSSSTKGSLATASVESSSVTVAPTVIDSQPAISPGGVPYQPYRPRPGIVLDDTEYRPAGGSANSIPSRRPSTGNGVHHHHLQTGKPHGIPPARGEIFDVTVSAVQGPGGGTGATVHIESVDPLTGQPGDIIVSPSGDQGFVSIDGKRTYLDLFGGATPTIKPSHAITGTGYAVAEPEVTRAPQLPPQHPIRPSPPRRPQQPPVRIDTCIVGDDSTCDQTQNEKCKTETGISSCQCRPGFARRNHRDPCRKVVAMFFSLRVDRMYDRKISWDSKLDDKESEPFRQLSYEAVRAVDSAFSMTPYSDEFVSGSVNAIYKGDPSKGGPGVFVNITVLLEESGETLGGSGGSGTAGVDITRHLLGVIQRRSNNVGASALWVDRPAGSVSQLRDVDECSSPDLNDCHELAACTNVWGSFKCDCPSESRDMWAEQTNRAGRNCLTCPSSHCNNRGTCSYRAGQPVCACTGAYYGSQCEVDGEVVGVAVGASLAALLVILLTLACLVMWSRRWSREQKTAAGMGSPVFGYMTGGVKAPNMGQPPYQVTLEERMRWAQLADVMAQANHYAQPEPASGHPCARPPSAMYGAYPTLPMSGTLPPVPMPRLGLHMGGSTMHLNAQSGNMNSGNTLASRANTLTGMGHAFAGLGMNTHNGNADSTSSESDSHAQDRADLLGSRGFHVPRPKSRSNATNSIANQSGIYYDVDYENAPDPIYGTKGIPLSTYTMNRQNFYRQ